MRALMFIIGSAVLTAGCSALGPSRSDDAAAYHMRIADSLEQRKAFREAAERYAAVAEDFPRSGAYPVAVRKAALLYASTSSSQRNDSLALRWFSAYLAMPLKKVEREFAHTMVVLLERIKSTHEEISRRGVQADSLTAVTRRQATSLSAESRRIQDLESELQAVQRELKKIKDIDLRLSKSRGRK